MYNTVAVIDDSAIERFLAETIIKSSGFAKEVISFNSGETALAYLGEQEPDKLPEVILVDIQMPVMNGFEFLDKYMELPQTMQQQSKIIMFSSTLSHEDIARVKKHPVIRAFIEKPLSPEKFKDLAL